jgi:hypothetical protein
MNEGNLHREIFRVAYDIMKRPIKGRDLITSEAER